MAMTMNMAMVMTILTGFILDAILGDPKKFPHIVRMMGSMITGLERRLPKSFGGGLILLLLVSAISAGLPFVILLLLYRISPVVGFVLESLLCWQLLAAKSLKTESMKVYYSLVNRTGDARQKLAMIVGRDTDSLDEEGIIKATVETVAESTGDGIIAPLFYMTFGGAPLACLYKAVNTLDSMVGYKNEKYMDFGRVSAKTDDVLNYFPARISALLMIGAAFLKGYDGKNAWKIWRRDRRKHESPNSAQTESACAGALGIQLAGPARYFGKLKDKPYIGDKRWEVEPDHIIKANSLMYTTAILGLCLALLVRGICLI